MNLTNIRPPVQENWGMYMVVVSIGTRPGLGSLYLKMDTGSGLTWTQCDPCHPQFHQSDPMFRPTESPTYSHIPCGHPLCRAPFRCINETSCHVSYPHGDGNYVNGILSRDTFTFQSSSGGFVAVPGLVFGCTHASHMNFHGQPSGTMGLGGSHSSFATQLIDYSDGRFSYCLVKHDIAEASFLRFGNNIRMTGAEQRTPITRIPDQRHHYLVLKDVSMNDLRLQIIRGACNRQRSGQGCVIIDTGLEFSRMIRPAYQRLLNSFWAYLHHSGLAALSGHQNGLLLDICYHRPNDFERFLAARLHIRWQELFWFGQLHEGPVFCLGIEPDDHLTVIGAMQQHNTRFTYDIVNSQLYFAPENCALDAQNP